ncbi:endonuclease/exonuclease/phosphatase family protein [Nocardioides sp.]|uniref:endonuclease/exonuclease/phosphatase family protein n=1 Tax=Nocardioides sp. TaxID=35761 RepID=UPI003512D488
MTPDGAGPGARPGRLGRVGKVVGAVAPPVLLAVLGLPALLLTLLRALQPDTTLAVEAVALTPVALPLYAAMLLVCGAALVRGRRRVLELILTPVALGGVLVHVWWLGPLALGEVPPPVAGSTPVVVMIAADLGPQVDPAVVVAEVAALDVDVLAVSETDVDTLARLDAAGLATALPYRAGAPGPGSLVLSRTPLREVAAPATTFPSVVVDAAGLRVLALHAAPPSDVAAWRGDLEAARAAAQAEDVDLVLGNANATIDHDPLRALVAAGWRDAAELGNAGLQPTWPAHDGLGPWPFPAVALDHIMVGERATVTEVETLDVPGSEHLAVVAAISPRSPGR